MKVTADAAVIVLTLDKKQISSLSSDLEDISLVKRKQNAFLLFRIGTL